MIGQDFQSTGTVRHINRRIGDGNGNPFPGPLKICYVKIGVLAVLTKDLSIIIRQLRGSTEHIYYPSASRKMVMDRRSVRDLLRADSAKEPVKAEEDWQAKFLTRTSWAADTPQEDDDDESHSAPLTFIDMTPTNIGKVVNRNALLVTDTRFCVHILDLDTHSIVQTFGKGGYGPGEFIAPSAASSIQIPSSSALTSPRVFHFIGDSQTTQKVRVFNEGLIQVADIGEMGPARCQFRDISAISTFDPHALHAAKKVWGESSSVKLIPAGDPLAPAVGGVSAFTGAELGFATEVEDAEATEGLPDWYRGLQSFEDLESMLYDEEFRGNFLVAQRRKQVFSVLHDANAEGSLDEDGGGDRSFDSQDWQDASRQNGRRGSTDHSVGSGSVHGLARLDGPVPMVPEQEVPPAEPELTEAGEKSYDVLFISKAKRLERLIVRENKNPNLEIGYYVSNSVEPFRVTYECLFDLIRAHKQHQFTLGGDTRKFVFVAVCDQGNYRVQVFRFYWTRNFMFKPELQLAYVIGGAQKKYIELFDPTSVVYTPTGELAVCDAGTNKVFLLSARMDVIRCISIPYCSPTDFFFSTRHNHSGSSPARKRSAGARRAAGKNEGAAGTIAHAANATSTTVTVADRSSGVDYLVSLEQSMASKLTFTDRELHPERYENEPIPVQMGAGQGNRTGSAGSMGTIRTRTASTDSVGFGASFKAPSGALSSLRRGSSLPSITDTELSAGTGTSSSGAAAEPSSKIQKLSALSTKMGSVRISDGGSFNSQRGGALVAVSTPKSGKQKAAEVAPPPKKKNNNKYLSTNKAESELSPEVVAERKKRKSNRAPCSVAVTAEGQLVVAYKSGGMYVYSGYEVYPVGDLCALQTSCLERILSFLSYRDIENMRNCCLYLHNFTKELRLCWRLFGPERERVVVRAIGLFVQWSKLDSEGVERPVFPLCDADEAVICPRYIKLECEDPFCTQSHKPLAYDRTELARLGAYIVYTDFLHFVSVTFDPKFLWQYEAYIKALYDAFGADKVISVRHDPMSRQHETVREQNLEVVRVLYFQAYLEVMTILEEQRSERRDIHGHKLFHRAARSHFVPQVDYSLDALERRMVVDPCEQYQRRLDVPHKRSKGKKLISLKGMEKAEMTSSNPVEEHCAVFNCHAGKAADLINRMFA